MTAAPLRTIPLTDDLIVGAAEIVRTERGLVPHRLPAWARAQCADPQLAMVEAQASGVRIAFRSEATHIELDLLRSRTTYAGVPPRADGIVDLVIDGERHAHAVTSGGTLVTIDLATGTSAVDDGPPFTARFDALPAGMKDVELWLPHIENVSIVALRADAEVLPRATSDRPLWVHHGSSISHGSNAAHPTGIWPAVAARLGGVELRNLGFGGSALLDPFVARTIRDAPADLISLKFGINVVNADLMRLRAFGPALHGFLDTVRDGHPTTPLLVMSPIFCEIHEDTPGPGAFDLEALKDGDMRFRATGDPAEVAQGKLTLTVIRREIERVVTERRSSDPHLFYLDGRELYGEADATEFPLPDALHPDAATHAFMGERFARLAFGDGGPLAPESV
ncbi:lipase [Salinibacterium sp. dk2585]|uniref:SGNH/GDSL hydrolase family protein n=1 Tax=unclassified Salinibacterium TaxID=2632331 RepID=UPI0011C24DFE|nr:MULTISPECIES: SGNH/GDSL hydrolase family protein [unclassified Salinibacterium]QEE61048.1 lipase [Salinibacterium sp. dk2585]TXK52990.1 lipase [Salinibacterium sp. dk5596]